MLLEPLCGVGLILSSFVKGALMEKLCYLLKWNTNEIWDTVCVCVSVHFTSIPGEILYGQLEFGLLWKDPAQLWTSKRESLSQYGAEKHSPMQNIASNQPPETVLFYEQIKQRLDVGNLYWNEHCIVFNLIDVDDCFIFLCSYNSPSIPKAAAFIMTFSYMEISVCTLVCSCMCGHGVLCMWTCVWVYTCSHMLLCILFESVHRVLPSLQM